ncbi:sugar ABC transporter substrate-binding protein [Micromonospora sp. NPDC048909]|uniref:ABC transporter substrate-binding protein n=1 Tax=Micromonospora sp. NPDC048909 TaxID=3155643 RepID=UPI0033F5BC8B
MTITRRGLLAGSVGALALGATSACGGVSRSGNDTGSGDKGDTGSLSTQGFGKPDDVGQARIDAFKSAYPNVQLAINEGDFDPQQFLSAVASGNAPSLVYLNRDLVGSYAAQGAIQPLDDHLASAGIKTGDYREAAIKEVTIDGKVYGVPEFYNTRNILVNGRALQEAGLTLADVSTTDWNKLHTVTTKLYKASGGGIARIGFDPKLPEFLPLWAKANGADLVNPDGSPNLDDPRTIEALTYALSLINEQGGWSKFKAFRDTWDLFGAGNQFVKNQAGAFPWEGWYVNVLVQSSPKLDLQSVPFTDKQGTPISFENGSAWCLPKGAKNPAAAINWMKVMTSTDTWLKAGAARQATVEKNNSIFTGLFTANPSADDQIKAKYVKPGQTGFHKAIENYYASTGYAFAIPGSKAGSEIKAAWQDAVNRALAGQQKPDAAMKQAQADASKAFSAAK